MNDNSNNNNNVNKASNHPFLTFDIDSDIPFVVVVGFGVI